MTYDAPQYYGEQPRRGGSGLAIAALVVGILALISFWTVIGGILLGLVAVVLGVIALGKRGGGRGLAIGGIITGALGLVLAIGLFALGVNLLNSESGQNLQDCLEQAGTDQAAQQQCQRDFQDDLTN